MKRIHIYALCVVAFICLCCLYSYEKLVPLWYNSSIPYVQNGFEEKHFVTPASRKITVNQRNSTSTRISKNAEAKCKPRSNLFFMKTHKTGSTTMQNILLRYAWTHNVTVGLPLKSNNFDYANRKKFDGTMVQALPDGRQINMLMHHMIFSRSGVSSVLPRDAIYFTFLRDPATQFESVYKYFKNIVVPFTKVKSLEEFMSSPQKFFHSAARLTFSWFAKNGIAFDLGFDNLNEANSNIQKVIREMDDAFNLVLISEYFDMSLILLREKLCWKMTDIAYLSVNARKLSSNSVIDRKLSQKIRDWNKIDTQLYNYYNKTFWKRITKYGMKRMQRDLKDLTKLKHELKSSCVEDGMFINKDINDPKYKMYNPPGVQMTQYHLTEAGKKNETCIQLILPEIPWWKKMTNHQRGGH